MSLGQGESRTLAKEATPNLLISANHLLSVTSNTMVCDLDLGANTGENGVASFGCAMDRRCPYDRRQNILLHFGETSL
jgi:hypothetical protein